MVEKLAKATLVFCFAVAVLVLFAMMAMAAKATWQYLSLPLYGCAP